MQNRLVLLRQEEFYLYHFVFFMTYMKNFIFLILMSVCMFSCSSVDNCTDNGNAENSQAVEYLKVYQQIDSLNQCAFVSESIQTRGKFLNWFKNVGAVVLADAIGGMFGWMCTPIVAVSAGTVASGAIALLVGRDRIFNKGNRTGIAPMDTTGMHFPPMNNPNFSLSHLVPSTPANGTFPTLSDSIGYYHNCMLLEIQRDFGSTPITLDTLIYTVAQKTSTIYGVNADYLEETLRQKSDVYENACSEDMVSGNTEDIHELVEKWILLYPEHESELRTLGIFLEGISGLDVEVNDGDYLSKALEVVNSSSLDEDVKFNLRNAFVIGNASNRLWNVEFTSGQ